MKGIKLFIKENRRFLTTAVKIFALGVLYFLLVTLTPLRIPCIFHLWTGLACPSCGISTMIVKLSRFDFLGAIGENHCIALLTPVWLIAFIVYLLGYPKLLRSYSRGLNILTVTSIVLLLAFAVIRNISGFEFLLPSAMR